MQKRVGQTPILFLSLLTVFASLAVINSGDVGAYSFPPTWENEQRRGCSIMKVSIVTPVYNGGQYLKPFFDSLVEQMDDIEFVCVDDGSTDGSRELLKEYAFKDKRFKAIYNEHMGVGTAVDTGIKAAQGDYIMLCDDDDLLMRDAVKLLYEASEGVADVVKGTALVEQDGKLMQSNAFKSSEPLNWREFSPVMMARHFLQPPEMWSYIFKRELVPLMQGGDYMFGDTSMVFKAKILAKDFRYIPEPVYCWRIHESASHSDGYPFDIVKVYDDLEKWLKDNNVNLWPVFGASKFHAYQWNLSRLSGETRERFKEYMIRDIKREVIGRWMMTPDANIALNLLLEE